MSVTASQLMAVVTVQGADKAKSDLQSVGSVVNSVGDIFKNGLGAGISFAANLAGEGLNFLKDQFVDSIKLAMQHQDVMAQTVQVLKSTHDASGMTATSIDNLATSLSQMTPFSEDAIESGENLLLTFTNIGKGVFPQVTDTALDMAQALHENTNDAFMQLGKALDDPIKGMASLRREGVTFTQQQQDQVAAMVASGNTMGAQKIILAELNKEFGGSATAAGKTFAGALAILGNQFDDIKEKVGAVFLPLLSDLVQDITSKVGPAFDEAGKVVNNLSNYFKLFDLTSISYEWSQLEGVVKAAVKPLEGAHGAFKQLSPTLTELKNDFSMLLVSGIRDVSHIIGDIAESIKKFSSGSESGVIKTLVEDFKHLADAFNGLVTGKDNGFFSGLANDIKKVAGVIGELSPGANLFDALARHAQDLGKWFQTSVVPAFQQAEPGFQSLFKAAQGLAPVIEKIADVVHNTFQHAFDALLPVFEKVVPFVIKLAGVLADGLGKAIVFLTPYISQAVVAIGQFANEIITRAAPIVANFANQVMDGINLVLKIWNAVWPTLAPILKGVWDEIVGVLKIAWSVVTGIINIALDLIGGNWKQAWTDMKTMFAGVWDGIKTLFQGFMEAIGNTTMQLANNVITYIHVMWDRVTYDVGAMINDVINWFRKLPGEAQTQFDNLVNNAKNTIGGLANDALTWGSDLVNNLISGIQGELGNLGNMAQNVANTISKYIHFSVPSDGPLKDIQSFMPDMVDVLVQGVNASMPRLNSAMSGLALSMATPINPSLNSYSNYSIIPQSITQGQVTQVTVNVGATTLDGRRVSKGLMPHIATHIQAATGKFPL